MCMVLLVKWILFYLFISESTNKLNEQNNHIKK